MKLKGVKIIEYNANGLFVYADGVEVENESIYGKMYSIPIELTPITELGIYNSDYEPVDMANYVDPLSWIPKNIRPEFEWLAMDNNGSWYLYFTEPSIRENETEWGTAKGDASTSAAELSQLIDTKPDPLG